MKIVPVKNIGSHKQGTLIELTKEDIVLMLGFEPNINDDPYKVKYSWGFTVDGVECAIWDWKGSHSFYEWSFYGPAKKFIDIFGGLHVKPN